MHDAGPLVHHDEVGSDHAVRALDVGVEGLVPSPDQRGPGECSLGAHLLPEHRVPELFRHDQPFAFPLGDHVGGAGLDRESFVRGKGPGRGRPRDDRRPLQLWDGRFGDPELHVHAGVHDVLVPERHLGVGEAGAAPGAVRHRLVVLVQQPLLVELLERPPHALDVLGVHREVGTGEVDPEPDAFGETLPVVHVPGDRLAAPPVELRDAERLDVALGLRTDLLLHLQLDGKPVAVPAGLAADEMPGHGPEARIDVLERP